MQTNRDRSLLVLLCSNAALGFISGSALTAEIAPRWAVAIIGLVSGTLSVVTATYVALTREPGTIPAQGISRGPELK